MDARAVGGKKWRSFVNPEFVPRQEDSSSCGVFIMFLVEAIERGTVIEVGQENAKALRWRAAVSLAIGSLWE